MGGRGEAAGGRRKGRVSPDGKDREVSQNRDQSWPQQLSSDPTASTSILDHPEHETQKLRFVDLG